MSNSIIKNKKYGISILMVALLAVLPSVSAEHMFYSAATGDMPYWAKLDVAHFNNVLGGASGWSLGYTTSIPYPDEWAESRLDSGYADRYELSLILGYSHCYWECIDPFCEVVEKVCYLGFGTHGELYADDIRLGYLSSHTRYGNWWGFMIQCELLSDYTLYDYAGVLRGEHALFGSKTVLNYYEGDLKMLAEKLKAGYTLKDAFLYVFIQSDDQRPDHKLNVLRMIFEDDSLTTETIYQHQWYVSVDDWKYVETYWWENGQMVSDWGWVWVGV